MSRFSASRGRRESQRANDDAARTGLFHRTIVSANSNTFARTGRQDHPSLPHWPAYDNKRRATMILDEARRVENDPGRERRVLWQEIAAA